MADDSEKADDETTIKENTWWDNLKLVVKILQMVVNMGLLWLSVYAMILGAIHMENSRFELPELATQGKMLIAAGMLTFLTGVIGGIGVWKEYLPMIIGYCIMIFLLIGLKIATIFVGWYNHDQIQDCFLRYYEKHLNASLTNSDDKSFHIIDEIQKMYDCCGGNNYTDFVDFIPPTCFGSRYGDIHEKGCKEVVSNSLENTCAATRGFMIGVLVTEVILLASTFALFWLIRVEIKKEQEEWAECEIKHVDEEIVKAYKAGKHKKKKRPQPRSSKPSITTELTKKS